MEARGFVASGPRSGSSLAEGAARQAGRGTVKGKRKQPLYVALQRRVTAVTGTRCLAHARTTLLHDRIGVELLAAGFHWHNFVHAAGFCRYYAGAELGWRIE